MGNEAPDPALDLLVARAEWLEERIRPQEQDQRSPQGPATEPQGPDVIVLSVPGQGSTSEEDHAKAPEGLCTPLLWLSSTAQAPPLEAPMVMDSWRTKQMLIGIVILALVTRVVVAVLTTSWRFPSEHHYWQFGFEMGQIAASLAMGQGFSWPAWGLFPGQPTAWMPPVYPYIMAGAFKAFGVFSAEAAIALEALLTSISAGTCILLYLLGQQLYNAHVGLLAALLLALYPASMYFAVRNLWDTTLFTAC